MHVVVFKNGLIFGAAIFVARSKSEFQFRRVVYYSTLFEFSVTFSVIIFVFVDFFFFGGNFVSHEFIAFRKFYFENGVETDVEFEIKFFDIVEIYSFIVIGWKGFSQNVEFIFGEIIDETIRNKFI
jgi:hypothetical protein